MRPSLCHLCVNGGVKEADLPRAVHLVAETKVLDAVRLVSTSILATEICAVGIAGVGIGMLSLLAPLYQSEKAHPSIRGRLTTLQQFFLGFGALVASFVVYGCSIHQAGTVFQWRFPLGLQIAPAVPLAFLIMLFPESPRWLMSKGREEEALRSLAQLHARGDTSDVFVRAELAEIKTQLAIEKGTASGWSEIFNSSQNIRKVAIGVILQFSVQITGVSAVQYYAPTIFGAFGYSDSKVFLIQSINSTLALVGEAACVLFIDKLGRRWPLITCNAIAGACFAVATALQARYPAGSPTSPRALDTPSSP